MAIILGFMDKFCENVYCHKLHCNRFEKVYRIASLMYGEFFVISIIYIRSYSFFMFFPQIFYTKLTFFVFDF